MTARPLISANEASSMTDKKTEKQLKRPDAFQTFFFHAFNLFKKEQKKVVLALVPVVLVIVGGLAWQYFRYSQQEKRRVQLSEIERTYSKEEKAPNKKKSDISAEIRKIEKAAKDAGKEADKALIDSKQKEMDKIVADHKESLAQYTAFFHSNEKSPEGWKAGMAAVEILSKDKKFEEASAILNTILTNSLGVDFYQVQVRLYAIAILEDQKKYDEGLKEVEKLIPLASSEILPRVLLTKARFQMESGKKDEGLKTLDVIIASHSASPEARQAIAIKAL